MQLTRRRFAAWRALALALPLLAAAAAWAHEFTLEALVSAFFKVEQKEARLVVRTAVEIGADIAKTSLEKLRPVTICPIRGEKGIGVPCGDFVFPDSDVHVSNSSKNVTTASR